MRALTMVAALGAGCANATYINPAMQPGGGVVEATGHFYLFGLAGDEVIPAYQMCPRGVAGVHSDFEVGDVLLAIFTIGIVTPRTYFIECGR